MPYIPLQLPPGVVKNGTKYQSKNRWFAADLVRWYEGAMQPISGWSQIPRNDAPDIEAAIGDDGAVFTDYTTAANNATTDDTVILPAVPAIDDAFYFGWSFPFAGVGIFLAQIATSGAGVFEYYNGTTWVDLSTAHNLVDNTEDMAPAGGVDAVYNVTWDIPTDWSTTTINSQGPFYYVRYRATTAHDATVVADYIDLFQTPIYVGEVVRGAAAWRDNSQASYIAFGTPTLLYVFSGSSLWDITPGGFTTGGADAVFTSGAYGGGSYGSGGYGTGDTSQGTITEAQTWQLDSFGEDLVACAYSDGLIYYWDLSVGGGTPAAAVTDSEGADPPIDNLGVVVTPERFVVALGADGDGRYIRWSDQEDANNWTGAAANQAGDFTLPGPGQIQCGLRNRNEQRDHFPARQGGRGRARLLHGPPGLLPVRRLRQADRVLDRGRGLQRYQPAPEVKDLRVQRERVPGDLVLLSERGLHRERQGGGLQLRRGLLDRPVGSGAPVRGGPGGVRLPDRVRLARASLLPRDRGQLPRA
jgi:hypothetical protein